MDEGTFLTSAIEAEIPALNVEFVSGGGTFTPSSGGTGGVISLNTARGTEPLETEEAEDPLSKYGVMFVCFVGILGAGFIAAMYMRYKKRKRRMKMATEDAIEMRMEDYEANLALQEEADMTKTEGESSSLNDSPVAVGLALNPADTPGAEADVEEPVSVINQVELGVPPVENGVESNEIEISLTGSKSWAN